MTCCRLNMGCQIIDMGRLKSMLDMRMVCRECAEAAQMARLRELAAMIDAEEGDKTAQELLEAMVKGYATHGGVKVKLPGVTIESETLHGSLVSEVEFKCDGLPPGTLPHAG